MKPINVCLVGNRPNFIKLYSYLKDNKDKKYTIIHSGQHYDYEMSAIFFDGLNIPKPDINLNVGGSGDVKTIADIMLRLLALDLEIDEFVVFGDTNTTLAGALFANKKGIELIHVEAGCRCGNKNLPEEINRIIVDELSDVNLLPEDKNYMLLTLKEIESKISRTRTGDYGVITIHRQENLGTILLNGFMRHIETINLDFVFPVHPRTERYLDYKAKNVEIIKPVGYFDFISMLKFAKVVITDSGGVQQESNYFKVPTFVLREESEWKTNAILVGINYGHMIELMVQEVL